jgi:UrcA family protein
MWKFHAAVLLLSVAGAGHARDFVFEYAPEELATAAGRAALERRLEEASDTHCQKRYRELDLRNIRRCSADMVTTTLERIGGDVLTADRRPPGTGDRG